MNTIAERWIGSCRRGATDGILITGERHLHLVLSEYAEHYNRHRPHRSFEQRAPDRLTEPEPLTTTDNSHPSTRSTRRPHPRTHAGRVGVTRFPAPTPSAEKPSTTYSSSTKLTHATSWPNIRGTTRHTAPTGPDANYSPKPTNNHLQS
ncbi:integrase core domain-containing protein [Streptomyces sp. NEAU-YJ-81]|uniref:integrase core domain-containing protein n=1 Tax=Streptomyces sp. NEAU-YJ-81 TaxID=2820288 RepID=UPI0027E20698|nr:integrase core domain-containing protein [Streptomyces sp. NEAU-YJ-81]